MGGGIGASFFCLDLLVLEFALAEHVRDAHRLHELRAWQMVFALTAPIIMWGAVAARHLATTPPVHDYPVG
ncbi:MAG: hypothetical protein DRI69_07620 [Bacteroidetes bacterium]|nr:MAG: hypothetical protein DRI69_07620 [Bacteroidota bacterium]